MTRSSYQPHQYWETRLSQQFTLRGVGYFTYPSSYNKWLYRAKQRVLTNALDAIRWNPHQISVLDIGSGTGYFTTYYAHQHVASYTGIDISETSVATLKKRFPNYAFYQSALGNPKSNIPSKKYHLIHCFDVIYHITDDHKFTRAIKQFDEHLSPGGWCLVTDFYGDSDQTTSDHAKQRSQQSWKRALQNTSLVISSVRPLYILLNRPMGHEPVLIKKMLFTLGRWPFLLYALDGILLHLFPRYASMNLIILYKPIPR